jgi:hypothetical protein
MKAIAVLLRDRKRAQRGSVLSGVLIITAFLCIIGGALMTELTTSFLLSRVLMSRVGTQATVNSAVELAFDQLQGTPLTQACPSLSPFPPLNDRTATVTYISCGPAFDTGGPLGIASSASFNKDGVRVRLTQGAIQVRDAYLVSDSAGNAYEYDFGRSSLRPGWPKSLGGNPTGPPTAMLDQSTDPYWTATTLVPISSAVNCAPMSFCVSVLRENRNTPQPPCFLRANARVTAAPAASRKVSNLAYFGDAGGTLFAYTTVGGGDGDGEGGVGPDCSQRGQIQIPGGRAVVAGPVVFRGSASRTDEIYLVTADSGSSQLVHYSATAGSSSVVFSPQPNVDLTWPGAVGLALETDSLPARLAITFTDGRVSVIQIAAAGGMSILGSTRLDTRISSVPYWCHCPNAANIIGVGGRNGALYLLDTSASVMAASPATGQPIITSPAADSAGDWFFGSNDGYLHAAQRAGPVVTVGRQVGLNGLTASSPIVDGCSSLFVGICVYLGTSSGAYLVPVDARAVELTGCIGTSTSCSDETPRLRATAEVGSWVSPRTVRVTGWSYYSPP